MRIALASCLGVLSVASAAAPSLAQGVPYNRGLDAADVTYGPSSSGAGFEISGDLHLDSDELAERDMGCTIRAMVNGAVVGTPVTALVISGGSGRDCRTFCNNCHGVCFGFRGFCVCITWGGDSGGTGEARFAIPVPPLHEGDVVTLAISPLEGSLPEIDTSDDEATIMVGAVAYNRGVDAADLRYETASAGPVITGGLHLATDGAEERDLTYAMQAMVNGTAVGEPQVVSVFANRIGGLPRCPDDWCSRCHGICISAWPFCICISLGGGNDNNGNARFALPVPPLHPGDVVGVALTPVDAGLPEIDTSDDFAVFTVGGTPCRGDFNGDGVLNSQDFFGFLTAFFALAPAADFNGDGATNSQDFFDFLGAFFAGC